VPKRPDAAKTAPPRHRLEGLLRAASLIFALVVLAATISHVDQLWRAMRADAEARAGTLARILSKDVGRNLASIQLQFDAVNEALAAHGRAPLHGLQPLLAAQTVQNGLVRELALVDAGGRIVGSSDASHVGLEVSGYDFALAAREGRMLVGLPKEGRSFAEPGRAHEGRRFARSGFLTVSWLPPGNPEALMLVAVIGADTLVNELHGLAGDDLISLAIHRYDGQLLATDAEPLLDPRASSPIFEQFIPTREQGGFTDQLSDGSRWIAHFDTTDDYPVLVEVRLPEATVTGRWRRELVEPLVGMALMLLVIGGYTVILNRSLRQQEGYMRRVKTQERRLRNILDTAADGIITIDQRGLILEYNLAAEAILQLPAAEAVGRPLTDVLPPDMAGHQAHLERYLATGRTTVIGKGRTVETRRRDGKPLVVNLAVSEVVDQGQRYFTGIIRDVTGIHEAEQRFETLFQRSGEPHLLFVEAGLVDCNEAAVALLRAPDRAALLGQRIEQLAATSSDSQSAAPGDALRSSIDLARSAGVARLEWTVQALDGTRVPVEMTLTPIRLAENDALLVAWHDIAERQRYESDLRAARDAAETAAAAKANFLAVMSHELRTPMTGIMGMIELLSEYPMSPEQQRFVGALDGSAQSLLRVLNDVLDYSKIEAGGLDLEELELDPLVVAREVVELLTSAASRRGNTLRTEWDADQVPRVRGDPTRLRQLLFNLVGNAIKFTERGTITLRILTGTGSDAHHAGLRFEVRDTGLGIPDEVLPSLFHAFQQADSSTTRRFGGTGLGLAICRRLVEAMGGEIGVESRLGLGSLFWFELRLKSATPPPPLAAPAILPVAASTPAKTERPLRILVAEDNPVNRLLLSTRLRRARHHVVVVEDGVQAVEAARSERFDLVLMDMQMPELDGAGATRQIRQLPEPHRSVPIVALTADALPGFKEQYMQSGLDDYLTKPVDWSALDQVLRRYAPVSVAVAVKEPA
jgi:PAS domain S-box-containing protein